MALRFLVLLLLIVLVLPAPVQASPVDYDISTSYSIDHKPKHDDNGKHKGWKKGKGPHGPGHNPPGHNNPPNPPGNPPANPPGHNNNPPPPANAPDNSPPPRNDSGPDRNRPPKQRPERSARLDTPPAPLPVCRVVIEPIEKEIIIKEIPKTRTVTEEIFYGAGIVTLIAVAAAVLMLLIGFTIGWFRRKKDEVRFIDSLLKKK